MMEPKQVHLRRTYSEAGWYDYCDTIWNPMLPTGYQFPIIGTIQYRPWCMTRDGCVTGLSIYAHGEPGYAGEVVHVRVSCNNGVTWVTPEVTLTFLEHCNEDTWNFGAYPFVANDLIHIEHKVTSTGGFNADWLEAVVEMCYE